MTMTLDEIAKKIENSSELLGATGNERLLHSGLMGEFDYCKFNDKDKAKYILNKLGFEKDDINQILH